MTQNNRLNPRRFPRAQKYVALGTLVGKVWRAYQGVVIRRQAIRSLQRLSDEVLTDIGIPRYAITEIIDEKINKAANDNLLVEPKTKKIDPTESQSEADIRIAA